MPHDLAGKKSPTTSAGAAGQVASFLDSCWENAAPTTLGYIGVAGAATASDPSDPKLARRGRGNSSTAATGVSGLLPCDIVPAALGANQDGVEVSK